ncbi:MAG: hypothetical protein N4A38_03145 [Candidatus Gracilibacteria bacterium]|nr:hypothetical protein [Candidatus Gracilibacteria bacterium]
MKFFTQDRNGICNIIALQHVLSFLDMYPTFEEIERDLTINGACGCWIPELGVYLENKGIKTKLISNGNNKPIDNSFQEEINKYKKNFIFEEKIPNEEDIEGKVVLINVDWYKIRNIDGGPGAHYVVLIPKEEGGHYLYDGSNYDKKVDVTFNHMYKASLEISGDGEDGMWLVLE